MAFSELGKLLELIEKVVEVMERKGEDLSEIKWEIIQMKQREEYR